MKKLTINDISAMELIKFSSQLEMTNTFKNWDNDNNRPKTESQIWDCLFTEAFGAFWNELELYNLIREYIPQIMNIVDHCVSGYVTCMDK